MGEHSPEDIRISHVVLAGHCSDIPAIRRILWGLPAYAYGHVFLEIVSPTQIVPLGGPPGIGVTWLRRDLMHSEIRQARGCLQGEALNRAVAAWVAEWMPESGEERGEHFELWMGCFASEHVEQLYRSLGVQVSRAPKEQ